MAYAALVSLAQTIHLTLNYHQDSVSPELKNLIKSVDKYIIFLQGFLEDFSEKVNRLEGRIRELALAAEDIIDYLLLEQIHESSVGLSGSKIKHQPKGKYEKLRYDFQELEKVTGEIESIAKQVMGKDRDAVVGLSDDLLTMQSLLKGESSKLEIIPIVGTPGIGKTTLARYVYDDKLIRENFDKCAWVTVSQDYSVGDIVSGLLDSMDVSKTKNDFLHVYQNLMGRRYLIVLDDVWSKKAWDELKMMFPDNGNGSRIMLTTRELNVATYVNSSRPAHEMRLMEDDHSWNLLRQKVFKQDHCPVQLEDLGRMIATSCKGLPLAIVVISGILAVDKTEAAWCNIANNVKSAISDDGKFDKILSLSYTHLPHHLKPCFLYVGGFPEDYEIRVSKLIKLWIAEGFLKPKEPKSIEETAEEYLEDLVKRSLVLAAKRKSNGRIKSFSIHDLIREMCIKKAQEENFFLHVRGCLQEHKKNPRRVSVTHSSLDFLEHFYGSSIHTIICLEDRQRGKPCSLGFFRLLRILDLVDAFEYFYKNDNSSTFLPAELFELFHLRYLAFDYPFSVPPAISNLRNLQTLIISSSNYRGHVVELPVEIWRMRQLRHLVVLSCVLPSQEGATSALENLQSLTKAVNLVCSEEIPNMIPNLKKLGIFYMERGDYQLHNLINLKKLEDLKIEMYNFPEKQQRVSPVFPRTLKKLTLSGLGLPWEDMNIGGSLPNLEMLKLRDQAFVGETWETTEEFSQLKFLLIESSDLQNWMTERSHFPRLKCLVLRRCWCLDKIPDDIEDILTLELIEVDDRNEPLLESAKQIQKYQHRFGNNVLQVRCIREFVTIIDDELADQMPDE